jgi:hypothetical protein
MNKFRNVAQGFSVLMVLCVLAAAAVAQVTGGAVTGTVVDPNGAVVSGAKVLLHDKARGLEFTAETTSAGSYSFPNVQTGTYAITVTASGFGQATGEVIVSLNQTATANVTLSVAASSAVVNITSETETIVQTDTSQMGQTFKERQFQDLPVGGDPNNLALLAPNVTAPPIGVSGAGAITGGLRQRANSFTVDGVDNNDVGVSGTVRGVIQDSVGEFSFLQNNFNAEFASGGAGSFNTITKSGTNTYHGSLFTYIGSQKLTTRSTEQGLGNKHFFKDATYGFTVGGPIPFPNFGELGKDVPFFNSGKDKLFFFVAAQKNYFAGEGSTNSYIAPTAAGLATIAALPGVSPFVIGLVQKAMPLAAAAQFDNCSAAGSGKILGTCGISEGNVNVAQPNSNTTKSWQANVDANLNAKNQLRFRYYHYTFFSADPFLVSLFASDTSQTQKSFSANWISNLSATLVNDARFGYIHSETLFNQLHDQSQFNFPVLDLDPFGLTLGPADQQTDSTKTYQYYDSLTWIYGKHTFKFGGEYLKRPNEIFFLPRHGGEYEYSDLGVFFKDLKPGDFNQVGIGNPIQPLGSHQWGAFAQDDWKIRHDLTLNLGVRWDYQSIYDVETLQALSAPVNIPGVVDFHVPKTDKNNFAPRVGFAWSPSFGGWFGRTLFGKEGDSSIRANYARSYVIAFSNLVSAGPPAALQGTLADAGPSTNFLAQGGATAGLPPYVFNSSTTPGSLILDHVSPYADAFAVSYQRQISRSTGIEVRYLRTLGRQLFVQVQTNSRPVVDAMMVIPTLYSAPTASALGALPTIGSLAAANPILNGASQAPRQITKFSSSVLTADPNIGKSQYDGISFSLNRRFVQHFSATAAYTYSRTYDNSFNELFTSSLNPRRSQDAGEFFQSQGLDLSHDWSRSIADVPNRFVTSVVYEVPFKSSNAFLNAVIGGWEVTAIFQAQSGQLVDIQSGIDSNLNGDNAGDRVFFNPNGNRNVGSGVKGAILNANNTIVLVDPGVTIAPAVGGNFDLANPCGGTGQPACVSSTPFVRGWVVTNPNAGWVQAGFFAKGLQNGGEGLAPRNAYRTRAWDNTDMVFIKNTRFGREGRYNFQIGAEAHNIFNQREINISGIGSGARSFTEPFTTQFLDYSFGVYGGRSITMRAKFIF